MNFNVSEIQLYQLLFYVLFGALLFIVLYIINNYVIPLIKKRRRHINKYWQKFQIICWLFFTGLFFIALIRANMFITLVFIVIVLGLGWNFWSNVFSGIVILFTNQFELGEVISTEFAKGELKSIKLWHSELINDKAETIIIPNRKLRETVVTHYHKKNNVQMHTFSVEFANKTIEEIYQMTLYCPYISANQKIEIVRIQGNEFNIKAAVIDSAFVEKLNSYFQKQV